MQVVVIDDTLITARLIAEYLKKIGGVDPIIFTDPEEGLRYCMDNEIDLLMVDYMMPKMNGLDVIRSYREQRSKEEFPIVMVTAMEERDVLRQAFEAGANDFVPKPLEPVELIARAQSLLTLRARTVELRRMATIDFLTNVFIRRYFMEVAEREVVRCKRYGQPLTLCMLDVDHFKHVNDSYGHAAGDEVLKFIAEKCMESLREPDSIGRLGGEEFAICLPETSADEAQAVAKRCHKAIEDASIDVGDGESVQVTVSIGLAQWSEGETLDDVLRRADRALYKAKEAGRNKVVIAA